MINQIEQLVALQKVDNQIFDIQKKLNDAPVQIAALKDELTSCEAQKKHVEDKLQHLHEQEKRLSQEKLEISSKSDKSKEKMDQVGNEKELDAVNKEMDTLAKLSQDQSDEGQALHAELELQSDNLKIIEEDLAHAKNKVVEAEENLASLTKESEAELAKLNVAREACTKEIPAPILSRYEFIRQKLKHPVIVSVNAGICTGCNISIPPQVFNELQRAQQIISCPNCQRLVFWNEHFKQD